MNLINTAGIRKANLTGNVMPAAYIQSAPVIPTGAYAEWRDFISWESLRSERFAGKR